MLGIKFYDIDLYVILELSMDIHKRPLWTLFTVWLTEKNKKGFEFLPQTQIFLSQYLCNLMVQTFDISNLDNIIYKY